MDKMRNRKLFHGRATVFTNLHTISRLFVFLPKVVMADLRVCKVKSLHIQRAAKSEDIPFLSKLHTFCEQWITKEGKLDQSVGFILHVKKRIYYCIVT